MSESPQVPEPTRQDTAVGSVRANRHVIFVPGKNPKPPAEIHRPWLWRCIMAGARRRPEGWNLSALDSASGRFHLAPWNRLYYGRDADIETDRPYVERMLAGDYDHESFPAAGRWRTRWTRFLYTLGDLFPSLVNLVGDPGIRETLNETQRYFADKDGVAGRIRFAVQEILLPLLSEGAEVMVVGHSLGSVIAYETLWELSWHEGIGQPIPWFITLGSPLGNFYVQRRLVSRNGAGVQRFPRNIRRWINVAGRGDLIALDRHLANDFAPMRRMGLVEDIRDFTHVDTVFQTAQGPNCHRCYGYFYQPLVAGIIARWLTGADEVMPPS